jgi:hypothetical protein
MCGRPIAADDINIKEGVALCRSCGKLSHLADISEIPAVDANALATPPAGCSYEEPIGGGLVLRASLRSAGTALGALAICLFWNGIVSVFVLVAIGGLYTHFIGALPTWFPVPGSGSKRGNVGPGMPLGETLFLCIFLIPFVAIGSLLFLAFVTSLIGRIEITLAGTDGRVRTGFGPFNWTRRFDPSKVKRVSIGKSSYQQNGQNKPVIEVESDRTVKFGSTLPQERRAWLLGFLQLQLLTRTQGGRTIRGAAPSVRR